MVTVVPEVAERKVHSMEEAVGLALTKQGIC